MHAHPAPPAPAPAPRPRPRRTADRTALPGRPHRVLRPGVVAGAARTLRHPATLLGLALTALAWSRDPGDWTGARYSYYLVALTPLWWAASAVAADSVRRHRGALTADRERLWDGRTLLAVLGPVTLTAVLVTAVLVGGGYGWVVARGGVDLGDEPGRTLHATWTLPELLQPVVLGVLAVALGAVAGRWLRWRLLAWPVLALVWFAVGRVYWAFQGRSVVPYSVVQVQPLHVPAGPAGADPQAFPADWLLSEPGPFQDGWVRLVVSPTVAGLHDVYLLGLSALLAACVLAGPWRLRALVVGAVLVGTGAVGQLAVLP